MTTQLKTITVSYGFVVACDPDQDPEQVARENLQAALFDLWGESEYVTVQVSDYAMCKPLGWDGDGIPYGGDDETTTAEYEATK